MVFLFKSDHLQQGLCSVEYWNLESGNVYTLAAVGAIHLLHLSGDLSDRIEARTTRLNSPEYSSRAL